MSAYYQYVGAAGSGAFTQSGGTNASSPLYSLLYIGGNSIKGTTGTGTYNLNAGLLSVPYVHVGDSGTGTFTQSGGTDSALFLGLGWQPGSSGTYNLNGGMLVLSSLGVGLGSGVLNLNGGTLQINSPFTTTLPIGLNTSGGTATLDTAGNTVTLSGVLSGPGGLTKTDSGTLVLTTTNTYSGGTTVSAGTLQLGNAYAVQLSTVTVNGANGLVFGPGITTAFLGALAGSGSVSLTTADSSPLAVLLSAGADNASTTYSGTFSAEAAP